MRNVPVVMCVPCPFVRVCVCVGLGCGAVVVFDECGTEKMLCMGGVLVLRYSR